MNLHIEVPVALDTLNAVVGMARQAGSLIMEIYRSGFTVDVKGDHSPLTAADLASHGYLVDRLAGLEPAFPVLSEESAALPFEQRSLWGTYWLIDPLDGTKEFIKRNDEFTVNVALIHDHRPVMGVVYAPALDVCYYALKGHGAFRQRAQTPAETIQVRTSVGAPLKVVGSRSHATETLIRYLACVGAHELVSVGSSLKLCLVAEGSADLYPRLGLTSEWDTAAAQCVVEAAGGAVTDIQGMPLAYNTKDSLLNPDFLVFGDPGHPWATWAQDVIASHQQGS